MPLKDRFRRAIHTDRSLSGSSNSPPESKTPTATNTPGTSGAVTPTLTHSRRTSTAPPTITLTKSNTHRLSLSKTLTWSRDKRSKEEKMAEKQQKRLEYWEEKDKLEWSTPEDGWKRTGKKRSKQHQDMLRAFEFDCETGRRRSMGSWISGVSPGQSRVGSVDSSEENMGKNRKRSSGAGAGVSALSREVTNEDEDDDDSVGHATA